MHLFILNLFYSFIFGALGLLCCCGLFLAVQGGGCSLVSYAGFSLWCLLSLQSAGSRGTGFSSCRTPAQQLRLAGSRACGLQWLWHRASAVAPGPQRHNPLRFNSCSITPFSKPVGESFWTILSRPVSQRHGCPQICCCSASDALFHTPFAISLAGVDAPGNSQVISSGKPFLMPQGKIMHTFLMLVSHLGHTPIAQLTSSLWLFQVYIPLDCVHSKTEIVTFLLCLCPVPLIILFSKIGVILQIFTCRYDMSNSNHNRCQL